MLAQYLILLVIFLFSPFEVCSQNNPDKPLEFEGYILSDSLDYSAETIDYFFDKHEIILNNNANIKYFGRILKSGTITYYQDYEYMEALGRKDSTDVLIDTPIFSERSGEELYGREIKYNLNSQEGIVIQGRTEYEDGFMAAKIIKRVSDDTLFIAEGTYTSCDEEHPHYYFSGKKMKFILNDKLIIKPIVAYVHDIPVMWFPFYVFPIAKGRQSGFLTPRYGSSYQDGRYFSNIGYYFAPSDFYDYRVSSTLRELNGWLINNWINYNKRYSMSGSIYGSFEDRSRQGSRQWRLSGSHRHTVSPTLDMTASMNMQSSEFSRDNSPYLYQRQKRDMMSTARIQKRWKDSGNNLTIYAKHQKNLDSESRTTVAPSFSFSMPKKLIFGSEKKKGRNQRKYTQKSSEIMRDTDRKWYENIYYSMNTNFKNTEKDTYQFNSFTQKYDTHTYSTTKNMGFSTNLSSSHKFMGWLQANPSLRLNETFNASNDSISYKRQDNLRAGVSLTTKVYGTFNPSIGSLKGLRHVITPSISYNYGKRRNYEGVDSEVLYRFDRKDKEKGRISNMSIYLRNLLQAKILKGEEERKIDLFALNFSSGINFEKDKRPVSPLNTTLDIRPSRTVTLRLTSTHDFYHDDDKFYFFSPYLTNLGVSTRVGISGRGGRTMGTSSRVNANRILGRDVFDTDIDEMDQHEETPSGITTIPININFTHDYRISRSRKTGPGKYDYRVTHTIRPTISFSPSKKFSINYNFYYDIKNKSLNSHRMVVRRDLHCWEANLSWVPSGVREGFYFKVNIRDLPDVKIEKRRGVSRFSR